MNDDERADWVQNDEGLYLWWQESGLTLGEFIKEHRAEIDFVIQGKVG